MLANSISPETDVTIVTDAGFHGSWFNIIRQQGWIFICRVLGNHHYRTEDEWEKVSDVDQKACSKPLYLGQGYLGKTPGTHHLGHFYLYKQKAKGRKTKRSKDRVLRVTLEKKGRASNRSPWLIFTNSTQYSPRQIMKIYSRRMQIEQNFRDEKNGRYGFALRDGQSHSIGRLSVLSLIASMASIILWLCGYSCENKGIHRTYQANTIKHRRVISLLTLAVNVLRHSPHLLTRTSLEKSLRLLSQRYTAMILVY